MARHLTLTQMGLAQLRSSHPKVPRVPTRSYELCFDNVIFPIRSASHWPGSDSKCGRRLRPVRRTRGPRECDIVELFERYAGDMGFHDTQGQGESLQIDG
jgi:hypothetical protein